MAAYSSQTDERHLDRWSWLTLAVAITFVLLTLVSTILILTLPTDGWQIPYNTMPPPPLAHFAGNWPTPLRLGDQVLAVEGHLVVGSRGIAPVLLPVTPQAGQTAIYHIRRGDQQFEVPVRLYRLDAGGILRSFWYTMSDTPAEWSWSIIALLVFFLRPRSPAARLILLAFVSNNTIAKLSWAASTISHNFAPTPVFYLNEFLNDFWGYLFYPAIILLALSFPRRIFPLTRWPRALPTLVFGLPLLLTFITIWTGSEPLASGILISEAVLLILAYCAALYNAKKIQQDIVTRAQALWVIFGFAVTVIPELVWYLLNYFKLVDLNNLNWLISFVTVLILPICLGIAITRYHLFDIYLIIRRTLQYVLLTGLLAIVYFTGIVLLQSIFSRFALPGASSQTQEFAVVLSTLAIAGLFNPLRRRVQAFIDKSFFRSKYNTEHILSKFSAITRSEVGLEPLTLSLVNAVEETLQPESISLWLKQSQKKY